jgi:hypothetical protein
MNRHFASLLPYASAIYYSFLVLNLFFFVFFFYSRFESKELKMLRVAVSSFYDYLNVVTKTMQEFDTTMTTTSTDDTMQEDA